MAILHSIIHDDLRLGNAPTVISLSCMILLGSFHGKRPEQICQPSRQGWRKQKSKHTLITLVMPPLMPVTANLQLGVTIQRLMG